MRLPTLPALTLAMVAPLLMGLGAPRCDELLEQASAELRREQYPTMLTMAQERQLLCPGPESNFLAGVAHANMLDRLLVPDSERTLVLEQALSELRSSVREVRHDWRQTALTWISYLEALPEPEMAVREHARTEAPSAASTKSEASGKPRKAAPPWEPDEYPWGPVLLGGAGAVALSAGLVTYLVANHMQSEIERVERACMHPCRFAPDSELRLMRDQDTTSTLFTISDVVLIAGGVSLAGSLLWYALRHTPDDPPPEVALIPWVGSGRLGAELHGSF